MSSSHDPETQRAAFDKAREGARLLKAGDYEGAIAACTEAIRLDPQNADAFLIRSEAYRLSHRHSSLRFISWPLVFIWENLHFIWEIPVIILGVVWWGATGPDAMEKAVREGLGIPDPEMAPPPQFPRFRKRDQRKLVQERLEALSAPTATERAGTQCAALRNLGIDASELERDPTPEQEEEINGLSGWIEIAEGPIRWVRVAPNGYTTCWIPDSRIRSGNPRVSVGSGGVKSFPPSGTVPWYVSEWTYPATGWGFNPEPSLRTADRLSQNTAITEGMILSGVGFNIETDLVRGCWTLSVFPRINEFTRPIWDCCQAITEALLAMPMPGK